MKTYRFCYSVDGVLTFLPTYVIVKSDSREKALIEASDKIKRTNMFVKKMGREFTIYS